jgi:hypothetical protein
MYCGCVSNRYLDQETCRLTFSNSSSTDGRASACVAIFTASIAARMETRDDRLIIDSDHSVLAGLQARAICRRLEASSSHVDIDVLWFESFVCLCRLRIKIILMDDFRDFNDSVIYAGVSGSP